MVNKGSLRDDGLTSALIGAVVAFILIALGFVTKVGSVISFSLLGSFVDTHAQ